MVHPDSIIRPDPRVFDGAKAAARRVELRLTAAQVAARIGCSTHTLYRWEANQSEPSFCDGVLYAEILGYSPADLVANAG